MPSGVSDCYPGKGIYLKNNYKISEVDGDCVGSVNARFGEAVMAGEHGGWSISPLTAKTQYTV